MQMLLAPKPQDHTLANVYWLSAFTLMASLAYGLQSAIEDEAFLMFLADSVIDEDNQGEWVDPLDMVEADEQVAPAASSEAMQSDEIQFDEIQFDHTQNREAE